MTSQAIVVAVAWVSPTTWRPAATRKEPSGEKLNLGMDHIFEGRQARNVGKNGKIHVTYDTYIRGFPPEERIIPSCFLSNYQGFNLNMFFCVVRSKKPDGDHGHPTDFRRSIWSKQLMNVACLRQRSHLLQWQLSIAWWLLWLGNVFLQVKNCGIGEQTQGITRKPWSLGSLFIAF